MNRKKNLIFEYLNKSCQGDLIQAVENDNWLNPSVDTNSLGYCKEFNSLYYNGKISGQIMSIFSINISEFKNYMKEWFEDRHKLKVIVVI